MDNNSFDFSIKEIENGATITFSRLLDSVNDLKLLDIKNEYLSACAVVFALARFETDKDDAIKMLEYINGPEDVSNFDLSFIDEQFDQYPYVVRSYFDGTSPENNYTISEVSLTITENQYSRDEKGYCRLFLHSSGADSKRVVLLKKKISTGEWFLFPDSFKGLLAGIKAPISEDKWA